MKKKINKQDYQLGCRVDKRTVELVDGLALLYGVNKSDVVRACLRMLADFMDEIQASGGVDFPGDLNLLKKLLNEKDKQN